MGRNRQFGKFQYSTEGSHLLLVIITRTTVMCDLEFANKRLFRPLGMKEILGHEIKSSTLDNVFEKNVTGWIKYPNTNSTGVWGLTITLRDMARFGFLYLNRGIWDNNQIILETRIDDSIFKYGYLWWLREESETFMYLAIGNGSNIICCIFGKDMVVAIASKIVTKPLDQWPLFDKYILPTINGLSV